MDISKAIDTGMKYAKMAGNAAATSEGNKQESIKKAKARQGNSYQSKLRKNKAEENAAIGSAM